MKGWRRVCVLVLLSVGWLTCKQEIGEPDRIDRSTAFPSWAELYKITFAALQAGQYETVRRFEQRALALEPPAPDLPYAAFIYNCAVARRFGKYGDPQDLLRRSEKHLPDASAVQSGDRLRLALARELIEIGLYRNAFEILSKIPLWRMTSASSTLLFTLEELLEASHPSLDGLPGVSKADPQGRVRGRLLDVLSLLPERRLHEKPQLVAAARTFFQAAKPFLREPFLLQIQEARDVKHPAFASSVEESDVSESPPSEEARRLVEKIQSAIATGRRLNREDLPELDLLVSLVGGDERSVVFLLEAGLLIHVRRSPFDEGEVMTDSYVVFQPFGRAPSWSISVDSSAEISLRDLNADGFSELMVENRLGSGGFLYLDVIEVRSARLLFSGVELFHGDFMVLDLDRDDDLELMLLDGLDAQVSVCGQCPRRFALGVYDFDRESWRFELRGVYETTGSWARGVTRRLGGLTAPMVLSAASRFGEDPFPALESLAEQPTSTWTDAEVEKTIGLVHQRHELLREAGFHSAAAQLVGEAAGVFDRRGLPQKWADLRARLHLRKAYTLYLDGALEPAYQALEEPWFLEKVRERREIFEAPYRELRIVLGLSLGRLDQAYEALRAEEALHAEPDETVEGNLALYFLLIGDNHTAYELARRALDTATRKDNSLGAALDMLHLASSTARLGRYEESLDWVLRGLAWHKRGPEGAGSAPGLIQIAASVALDAGYPRLTLALLDESFAGMESLNWRTQGGSLLLLYGKALQRLGYQQAARAAFSTSARVSRSVSSSTFIGAHHELSRMAYTQSDFADALRHAREAFEAIATGRVLVREEQHKFSFLAEKEEVAAWFFRLLLEASTPAPEMLDALESWKMQTFLDLHEPSGSFSDRDGASRQDLGASLGKLLARNDLLIDFAVSEQSTFAIHASPEGALRLARLPCRETEIRSWAEAVRSEVDVRVPETLRHIRSDLPGQRLEQALRKLGHCLLDPLQIPPGTKRLLIASDKVLLGLPWSALVTEGGRPVVARFEVVQIPSVLVALRQQKRREGGPERQGSRDRPGLVVGALGSVAAEEMRHIWDREASAETVWALPPLNNGWQECQGVAGALAPRKTVFLLDQETHRKHGQSVDGRLATPEALIQEIPRAGLVHVVAHGAFNPRAPMQSVLFLEKGDKGRVLRALDLAGLDLREVDLVSLAACQTGVSGARPGAEPIGFVRALLGAGAKSVLLADWEVDDRTTASLFSALYTNLRRQPSKSRALREAQLATRRKLHHPYFWAGISLHGLP